MSKLRKLVEEIGNIDRVSAREFINELQEVNESEHHLVTASCEDYIADIDLVSPALDRTHFEERAKKVLALIERALVCAVTEYVKDKLADYHDEDEARLEDFECTRDTLQREMLK